MATNGRKLPKVLKADEVKALFDQINTGCPTGLRNRAMLQLMYRAGLRLSEVLHLAPGDVDGGQVSVIDGKGGSDRVVGIDADTADLVRRWKAERPARTRTLLFTTLKGKPLSPRYMQQLLHRLAARAGVRDDERRSVTPHVLRHTYATELLEEGYNLREVQHVLGHANVQTTQVYTHVAEDELMRKLQNRNGMPAADETVKQIAALLVGLSTEQKAALAAELSSNE